MSVSESEPSKVVQKIHEALGVRLVPPPPEGFDPVQASDSELSEHGYPVRPDIELHPKLHERWNQMMSRPMTFIEPQFAVLTHRRYGRQDVVPPDDERRADLAVPTSTEAHWSGSVATPEFADAVTFVSGQWTIPAVIPPPFSLDSYSSIWVGIDGGAQNGFGSSSTDILQAGTEQNAGPFAGQTYPWFEWYSGPQIAITNLAVRPGDVVFCAVTVHTPTEFGVFMFNMTTRRAAPATVNPPTGTRWTGDSVEWILETPGLEVNHQIIPTVLPQYGEVYFDQCFALTRNHKAIFAGQGVFYDQFDINDQKISTAIPITDTLFKVLYTAEPWA